MSSKKIKKTDLSITVLLIIGILVVVNFFSYQIFYRWDLTQNKVYSISKVSKKAVGQLEDIVNIKAYFSANLPSQMFALRQEVADILDEYAAFSNGKIRVEFIDPNDDEATQRELMMIGIPKLTFEVYEKDQMQLVNGYMGIAVSFGGKIEAIPTIKRNTSDLEYQLTTAIKKVVVDEIAIVGFLTSHGAAALEQGGVSIAHQELQKLYTVRTVELTEEDPAVPADIDTLIIVGPKEKFNEAQLKAINTFLMRGGSLLAMVDGVKVEQGLIPSKNSTGLEGLLDKYGVKLNNDLVADARSGMASFSQGFFTFSTKYPFWPQITNDGFNQEHSAVANLENVVLPWASSIEVNEDKIGANNFSYLAFTTPKAWAMKDNYNINPQNLPAPQGEQKQYNLAVAVNNGLESAYEDNVVAGSEGQAVSSGRLVVVGDSDFIGDGFLRNNPDNLNLFQNLVDSLSFDEDLISIRSKGVTSRPIKEGLSDGARTGIRYANILGLTIAVILFGMVRYFTRRKSRFVDEL